jgi:hypothetical protein
MRELRLGERSRVMPPSHPREASGEEGRELLTFESFSAKDERRSADARIARETRQGFRDNE